MKIHRMRILFWQRVNKINRLGECPIYCRITINRIRAKEFSTGVNVKKQYWNAKKQTVVNNPIKQGILNEIKHRCDILYLEMIQSNQYPNANEIREHIRRFDKKMTIQQLAETFYFEFTKANDCVSTHKKQKTYLNNFTFFISKSRLQAMPCNAFDNQTLDKFKQFLREKHFVPLVINKHLSFIKQALKLGVRKNLIKNFNLVIENERLITKLPVFLFKEEIEKIEAYDPSYKYKKIKDCFLFQCFTGLAFADLKAFNSNEHIRIENGVKWIIKAREKTAVKSHLPLLEKAEQILKSNNYKLPLISYQKYNQYVTELGKLAGIKTHITTHVARSTFGSLMLNSGVSMETVSSMLGHDKIETTQRHYARVDKRRVNNEMDLICKAA